MYMQVLKLMKHNPEGNVINKKKQSMVTITEDPNNLHNAIVSEYKTLDYNKKKKAPRNSDVINRVGVIGIEGEVDEFIQKRGEFSRYCQKLVDAAVKEKPMNKKDAAKSPIKIAAKEN